MVDSNAELPQGYILRQAREQDKWMLQKLVWEFQIAEALDFDLRVFSYRLFLLVLLSLGLLIQIWIFQLSDRWQLLKLGLSFGITYTTFYLFKTLYSLFLLLKYSLVGAMLTWSSYWVIECDRTLVGCASLVTYNSDASLGYVFVRPQWRSQGLASYLIKYLMTKTSIPVTLVCKPKMIKFYANLDFIEVPWAGLSYTAQAIYHIFRPHPKLIGIQLIFMRHNPVQSNK
jgi:N-acetylglutamate synthase-like GNAT family acetyltransferase